MTTEELLNIKEVIQTISTDEANRLLKEGWKLLDTTKTQVFNEIDSFEIVYLLGRPF